MKDFFVNLFDTIGSAFKWSFSSFRFSDALDIILIAFLLFTLLTWVRKTKAWTLFKGIAVLFAFWALAQIFNLNMTKWIFERALSVGILAVIIIFQPELRRALEQLGRGRLWGKLFGQMGQPAETISPATVRELNEAMTAMAAVKTGALICVEQKVSLSEYENSGIALDAKVTSQLLINIFEKNTPLHDGAVVVKNNRITAATCYLPLSDNDNISKELGTRHRAALGLSEATDAMVFIVSEETGQISMAYNGRLYRNIDEAFVEKSLLGTRESKKNRVIELKERLLHRKEHSEHEN